MKNSILAVIACFGALAAFAGAAAPNAHNGAGAKASGSPAAQAVSEKNDVWLFTTESQMRVEIEKYLKKPRDTYFIIMRSQHENLGPAAAMAYREWRKKRIGDPLVESAYAFSQWMAAGELAPNYTTRDVQPLLQQLRSQQMEARYYRAKAIKARPNSPEVLLETALPMFFYPCAPSVADMAKIKRSASPQKSLAAELAANMVKNKHLSVNGLRRAARLAPDWADTHYWLGSMLVMLWPLVNDKATTAEESIHALGR
ncbi:MAG TPA: hypothetical protein VFJ58_05540, partial [Armatimonadota bacterium]|nr:hypothetical protein [Armatimonadota bacterium]